MSEKLLRLWYRFISTTEDPEADRDGKVPWYHGKLFAVGVFVVGLLAVVYGMQLMAGSSA